jgi:hypothetical protein
MVPAAWRVVGSVFWASEILPRIKVYNTKPLLSLAFRLLPLGKLPHKKPLGWLGMGLGTWGSRLIPSQYLFGIIQVAGSSRLLVAFCGFGVGVHRG